MEKEIDQKKLIEIIKYQLLSLSQGSEIQKNSATIMGWFTTGSKLVKTLSYPLVKALTQVDWGALVGTLTTDLVKKFYNDILTRFINKI